MKSKKSIRIPVVLAFLAGAAIPTGLIWNPGHWNWAEQMMSGLQGHAVAEGEAEGTQLWTCGMHPQVIQDHPGICPICNMNLTPLKESPASTVSEKPKEKKIKYWVAPMDPNYISDKPGKSPMGMDLVPVYEEEEPAATGVHVDPNFIQNFAVRTTEAQKGSIPILIRTIGTLDYNQKNIVSVNTKFEGWIEKANVNYIGESVKRGDVLFEIYSPPLVTTQQEYLATLNYLEKLRSKGDGEAVARAESLLEATRERLHYWDITDDQIEELKGRKTPMRTLKILSPASGIIIEKMGDSLEGTKLIPGMNVFKIADLSNVWVEIEVFEHQIQYLKLGQKAEITLDAFPGSRWTGKIIYLNPRLNQKTRTLTAYVEIGNSDRKLRPEMYANVEIRVPAVSGAVKIPSEAILRTGERNVVVVEKDKGFFEPREVTLGAEGEGYSQVTGGLREGETVVVSSQFLIDSESNLKEAISKLLAARKKESENPPAPEHTH
ncbi:MAG: efflux RND transporter periplasmic adaptor subunit [Acidobacteria bacterium]|nr:efflux RND transporter periplasmic adaptor subunit [Acidobacteriota bacterium]